MKSMLDGKELNGGYGEEDEEYGTLKVTCKRRFAVKLVVYDADGRVVDVRIAADEYNVMRMLSDDLGILDS